MVKQTAMSRSSRSRARAWPSPSSASWRMTIATESSASRRSRGIDVQYGFEVSTHRVREPEARLVLVGVQPFERAFDDLLSVLALLAEVREREDHRVLNGRPVSHGLEFPLRLRPRGARHDRGEV